MEQEGLFLFKFGNTGQAKLAAIAKIEPDLDHHDRAKALQGAGRVMDWATAFSICLRQTHKQ